jgi:hypothetical protein
MSDKIVPFGKYKNQPVELMLADRAYCEWLAAQPWFKERFAPIYNIIIQGPFEEQQCTPEHNAMQNLFVLERYPYARAVFYLCTIMKDFEIISRKSEVENWDIRLVAKCKNSIGEFHRKLYIELKPTLGDDYPSVMRKMLSRVKSSKVSRDDYVYTSFGSYPQKMVDSDEVALVIDKFQSAVTNLEDLSSIFEQHNITVLLLSEIKDYINTESLPLRWPE